MKSLKGQLLIASPRLLDPNFFHAVVLMIQHDENGAMGLIVNRPLTTTVQEMWKQVAESDFCTVDGNLHQGGPCEGPLMVLHGQERHSDIEVIADVHFCARKDAIENLVAENDTEMRFFVGYAGWGPGQLESEMEEGSWLVAPASAAVVFHDAQGLWGSLSRRLVLLKMWPGLDPGLIPEDSSVN